jgi:Dolichyl-phosphate-mannose-protein mannosyltransferase/Cellulase (glycosyl hydrolase family 5)
MFMKRLWPAVSLLLVLWATRLNALELLPLHNDEGLHLTRAVEVWNGHPFWVISDGKIINHWLIAAFYPQHEPVFAGRVATVFVAVLGLAAGYALIRRIFGESGAVLAGALWIASPYLFFYERLAFSDAEAGALVVAALWAGLQFTRSGRQRYAALSGLAMAAAILFKFTAAPFGLGLILVILFAGHLTTRQRWLALGVMAGVGAACFAVPLGYLALREKDFFTIALGWIGGSSGGGSPAFFSNAARLWSQLVGFGALAWVVLTLLGLAFLLLSRRRLMLVLLAAFALPLLVMMILGREVLSRHYVVALPLALTLGGGGLTLGLKRIRDSVSRQMAAGLGILALVMGAAPIFLTAYSSPDTLPLPDDVRYEHITSHSSGYGLREAVQAFPQTLTRRDLLIVGSMFPDSCRRANFYAVDNMKMDCAGAPGTAAIEDALNAQGAVYALVDNAPNIGIDVTTLDAAATRLAAYPRPGETEANASVVLWLLEKPSTEGASVPVDCSPEAVQIARDNLPAYTPSAVADFVTLHDGGFFIGDMLYSVRGVNYYPAHYPWRRFLTQTDSETVKMELTLLRATGFNTLRIFLWNEALFACPNTNAAPVREAFLRLDDIIYTAAGQGFRLIVTLNDLADPAMLYTNPSSLQEQTQFIVDRYRGEAAIMAWDLRNEGDIDYGSNNGGSGAVPREAVLSWLASYSAFVRGEDSHHLITAGWLYDNEATADDVDFISIHHWMDTIQLETRVAAIRTQSDKPILLEEFGYSTFRVTPDQQSTMLLATIQTSSSTHLLGWLIWTAFDFPLDATCIPPACPSTDNAEHHFGLWNSDYMAKPVVQALLATN